MRGKAYQRNAQRSFQRWQRLHFNALCDNHLPTPLHLTLRLPVLGGPPSISSSASISLQFASNNRTVLEWWKQEYAPFIDVQRSGETADGDAASLVLGSGRVHAHVGAPTPPLGYPPYIAAEAKQYTEGVLRGETYAYHQYGVTAAAPPDAPFLSPVRWIRQPLLDGFVAQRLTAHTGVTTATLLEARSSGATLGRQVPPYALSPYFAANSLLDRWCLFGEAEAIVPQSPPSSASSSAAATLRAQGDSDPLRLHDVASHHHRIAELALAAAVVPNYRAVWLNGAVLTHRDSGRSVLVLGQRRCGKTTLALHCLSTAQAAGHAVQLTAAEHFFIGAGTPVRGMLHGRHASDTAAASIFLCSLPQRVRVGLGAVLGTLRPNPALAAVVELPAYLQSEASLQTFLRNPDGIIWHMSHAYRVRLEDITGVAATSWAPAVVSTLAGVVLLDWDVAELSSRSPTIVRNAVRDIPLHAGGVEELLERGRDDIFRGHHLLDAVYRGTRDGPTRLVEALAAARPHDAHAAPALHCITGSVNFNLATELITGLLLGRAGAAPTRTQRSTRPPPP